MIATSPRPPADGRRHSASVIRGLGLAVLLALAPKCLLCVAAYGAAGAALQLGAPEICGAPAGAAGHWTVWLFAFGLVVGVAGFFTCLRGRRADKLQP